MLLSLVFYLCFYLIEIDKVTIIQIQGKTMKKSLTTEPLREDVEKFNGLPVQKDEIDRVIKPAGRTRSKRTTSTVPTTEENDPLPPKPTEVNWAHQINNTNQTDDFTNKNDKRMLWYLSNELYEDSKTKVHSTNLMAQIHSAAMAFEVGHIIGLIQAHYRHQMELWREVMAKEVRWGYPPRTRIWPQYFNLNHTFFTWENGKKVIHKMTNITGPPRKLWYYMTYYGMIWELEREISKLSEMLENIPRRDMQLPNITLKHYTEKQDITKVTLKVSVKMNFDRHEIKEENAQPPPPRHPRRNFEEEKYKHRLREQFLLRKLGLNDSGHTEKPRFVKGWPVEGTWDNIPQY